MAARRQAVAVALVLGAPGAAWAGMPAFTLSDVATLRVQTLSFFLVGLLGSAALVQLVWNSLRKDFPRLPRLSYGKAVGVVVLWGLLFVVVLTMISGARELMTPGAWEKHGATYRLVQPEPAPPGARPADTEADRERLRRLERLRDALWASAESHGGQFPESDAGPQVPSELWLAWDNPPVRFRYVAGQATDRGPAPLVYEPGFHGDRRLVLLTDRSIREMSPEEIARGLPPEEP